MNATFVINTKHMTYFLKTESLSLTISFSSLTLWQFTIRGPSSYILVPWHFICSCLTSISLTLTTYHWLLHPNGFSLWQFIIGWQIPRILLTVYHRLSHFLWSVSDNLSLTDKFLEYYWQYITGCPTSYTVLFSDNISPTILLHNVLLSYNISVILPLSTVSHCDNLSLTVSLPKVSLSEFIIGCPLISRS